MVNPGLIFYPIETKEKDEFNPKTQIDPYILFTGETYNLPLEDTSLVILSCCETAFGELRRGEGIIGLSRGFLYSGSSSVACSLWSVNDKKTAELWIEFFKILKNNKDLDYATILQRAKMEMIKRKAEPFYWSPFVLIGRG